MATTTSLANTGLLDHLLGEFKVETGIQVDFVAVGTGKALKHGEGGDVDVVFVHAPPAEEKFIADGFGAERVPVMWNDFVILGPATDPAGVLGSASTEQALRRIMSNEAPFVSRGDDSGTHKKERQLWAAAGLEPRGSWYVEAGQGMGACLTMADDMLAYVLTDRGTYLSRLVQLELQIAYEGDSLLVNPYSIIAINPNRYPDLNHGGVDKLIDWLTSARGQALIAGYELNGHRLFHPVTAQ
jgi:tungstate transport system substrate-binding protein